MTGSVELDRDGTTLVIRFPYREDLVAMVKALPGRRWDPRQKSWRVPAAEVEAVYAAFSRQLFNFAPEISALLAGTLRPAAARNPAATAAAVAAPALTVAQLNERIRSGLREQFPAAIWVVGEVVDFDKSGDRQHRFFRLADRSEDPSRRGATIEAALFAATAERLLPRLAAGEPPLTLRDGLELRLLVRVDLYPGSGRLQVVVEDVDPEFTLGKLLLNRELILRELVQLGLAERNRQRAFPVPALRIGVLTSPDADGWLDFRQHLDEAAVGFDVTLFPIRVQGVELRPTLLAGLRWFAARSDDFDLLCIVRGGGSRSELAWFDDREVALAVARHPLKVIVGIGHQRDQSILDCIAHSEKTPTAVAELLVRAAEGQRTGLQARADRLRRLAVERLEDARTRLATTTRAVADAVRNRLRSSAVSLASAARELAVRSQFHIEREGTALRAEAARALHMVNRLLDRQQARIERCATRHRLLDPRRVLQRGYTQVRLPDGRIAPTVSRLAAGQTVFIEFRDGRAQVDVAAAHPHEP